MASLGKEMRYLVMAAIVPHMRRGHQRTWATRGTLQTSAHSLNLLAANNSSTGGDGAATARQSRFHKKLYRQRTRE